MIPGLRYLNGKLQGWRQRRAKQELMEQLKGTAEDIDPTDWHRSLTDPTSFYHHCFHYYLTRLPETLREHRRYFSSNQRGFGEDAFHSMWFLLLREFKPTNFLEIGVFRGQTISLVTLCSQLNSIPCKVWGISPFSGAEDSVSKFPQGLDYYSDTLANFDHFKLPRPTLLRAYSTDPDAVALIGSKQWDMIFIDGNHDYPIVKKDWEACAQHIKPGGVIVMDDSGLMTSYRAPLFSFAGWPGPSQIAKEVDRTRFKEIMQVGHNRVFQRIS